MFAVDCGAAQLQNPRPERLIGGKTELLLRVISQIPFGGCSRLHPVRAHDAPVWIVLELVLDEEVLADQVELVGVEAGAIGSLQPFAELDVEDFEAQAAGGDAIFRSFSKPHAVAADFCPPPETKTCGVPTLWVAGPREPEFATRPEAWAGTEHELEGGVPPEG